MSGRAATGCFAFLALAAGRLSAQPSPTPTPAPTPTPTPSGALVVAAGPESLLALGGLLQVQFEAGDRGDSRFSDANDRIYLRRARLNASGRFLEKYDFRLEVELAGTLASTSSLRAQLTDAFVAWRGLPALNIWVGQFKTYYGFEFLSLDPRLFTIERSLVTDRLTVWRQLGAGVGGDLLGKRVAYSVGAFNGNAANNSFNDNDSFLVAGRLSGSPWLGVVQGEVASWSVGVNGYMSEDASVSPGPEFGFALPGAVFSGNRAAWGFDTQLHYGPLDLWAEFLKTQFRPTDGLPAPEVNARGWYVQATGYVLPPRLQLLARYETFNPNPLRPDNDRSTWTFGANYYIRGNNLKLQLDYLRTELPAPDPVQGKLLARVQAMF